jgi:hypothetical protein
MNTQLHPHARNGRFPFLQRGACGMEHWAYTDGNALRSLFQNTLPVRKFPDTPLPNRSGNNPPPIPGGRQFFRKKNLLGHSN